MFSVLKCIENKKTKADTTSKLLFQTVTKTSITMGKRGFNCGRSKRFMLDEMTYRNASNFAIFLEYENPHSFFHFVLLYFFP